MTQYHAEIESTTKQNVEINRKIEIHTNKSSNIQAAIEELEEKIRPVYQEIELREKAINENAKRYQVSPRLTGLDMEAMNE